MRVTVGIRLSLVRVTVRCSVVGKCFASGKARFGIKVNIKFITG